MAKPTIRFKGYTEDWEQRKFGELVTIERGGSPRPIDKFITKLENHSEIVQDCTTRVQ